MWADKGALALRGPFHARIDRSSSILVSLTNRSGFNTARGIKAVRIARSEGKGEIEREEIARRQRGEAITRVVQRGGVYVEVFAFVDREWVGA